VLDQVADHTPGPGGGAVAALTVAFAAALVFARNDGASMSGMAATAATVSSEP